MSRPNSYGALHNRKRRKSVAYANSQHPQVNCLECNTRHRQGRCSINQGDNTPIDLTRKASI